jgi:hypothetical protein
MAVLCGRCTFVLTLALALLVALSAGAVDDQESPLLTNERDPVDRDVFFFSFGELSCRRDLRTCLDKRGPGDLSLDAWAALLGEPSEDNESDSNSDQLEKLRKVVEQAALVDFTEIFKEMEAGTIEESVRMAESASDILESIKAIAEDTGSIGVGPIGEDNVEGFLNFFNGIQEKIYDSFDPPLRDFLGLLVNIIFLPIIKPLGIIFAISVWLAYLRRPFTGGQLLRSSTDSEAQHLKCKYETFLVDTIPTLVKEVFIGAGNPSPGSLSRAWRFFPVDIDPWVRLHDRLDLG